jgi:hypothetical protein
MENERLAAEWHRMRDRWKRYWWKLVIAWAALWSLIGAILALISFPLTHNLLGRTGAVVCILVIIAAPCVIAALVTSDLGNE